MIGLGTIINAGAIVLAGIIGSIIGNVIKERFQQIVLVAIGLCVLFMAVASIMAEMLTFENGSFDTRGTLICIFSLVLGGVIGEIINLDKRAETFGSWLKKKSKSTGDTKFVDGFVTASVTVCIGAMAVIGSINDGLTGDYSILLTKSIIDFVTIIIMSASMGKGCAFSAIPVFVFQGLITVLAKVVEPIMTDAAMSNLNMVGSILIFCVGLNILFMDKLRIKVANLLPAIIFAVVATYIPFLS